jgi:hypothetical protein
MRLIALSVLLFVHLSAETQTGKESIKLRSVRHFKETLETLLQYIRLTQSNCSSDQILIRFENDNSMGVLIHVNHFSKFVSKK